MQVKGYINYVSKHSSGTNERGDWSVQGITVKDGGQSTQVKIWNRPDMASAKGKYVEIDGVVEGKGKDKDGNAKDILELKGGAGKIEVKEKGAGNGGSKWTPEKPLAMAIADYNTFVANAIDFVSKQFKKAEPASSVSQDAVAHIVAGYQVALAKGHVVLTKSAPAPTSQQEPNPDDIPF